jgi:hypothetical protein
MPFKKKNDRLFNQINHFIMRAFAMYHLVLEKKKYILQ